MSRFLVYRTDTGQSIQVSVCDSSADALSAFPDGAGLGAVQIGDDEDDSTHYFDVQAGELLPIPPQPGNTFVFDPVAGGWQDPRTLEQHKADKIKEIKAARDAANDAPKATSYGTFDADPEARSNITSVAAMAQTAAKYGSTAPIKFTLANGVRASFTLAEFEVAALQVGGQVQANFDKADQLLQQIDEATTIEAVEAVVW